MYFMIKLIASDLDGTLLDSDKHIDAGIFSLLPELKKRGIEFTTFSGRNEKLAAPFVDELNVNVPYGVNNGGEIYYKHGRIDIEPICSDYNQKLMNLFLQYKIPFACYCSDKMIRYGASNFFKSRTDKVITDAIPYEEGMDFSNEKIVKVTTDVANLKELDEVKEILSNNFPELIYIEAETDVYCINSRSANKGNALEKICEHLNISLEEVMVFGDSYNDIPMLEKAGYGVAIENAEEDVKAVADAITTYDHNHQGVSTFLKEYFQL